MKKFINLPENAVEDMLQGLAVLKSWLESVAGSRLTGSWTLYSAAARNGDRSDEQDPLTAGECDV